MKSVIALSVYVCNTPTRLAPPSVNTIFDGDDEGGQQGAWGHHDYELRKFR